MDSIKKAIDDKRNIKPNSLRAYLINIKKVFEGLGNKGEPKNLDFLKDEKKVLEFLSEKALTTQKNYLTGIIIGLDSLNNNKKYDQDLKVYRKRLGEYTDKYNKQMEENKKTGKQKENWSTMKELKKVISTYKADLMDRGVFGKDYDQITKKQFDLLQKFVVGSLYIYEENPPVRLDYGNMKIIKSPEYEDLTEDEKEENNYLVVKSRNNKFFHFGDYKTSKNYGTKKITVGKKLNSVLNIWLKFNKTDEFLLDSRGNNMTSNQLSKYLNKVFAPTGKRISANMLRHIYITEKHPVKEEESKEDTAEKMMHSVSQQKQYSKK